jgi:hypothetical protein
MPALDQNYLRNSLAVAHTASAEKLMVLKKTSYKYIRTGHVRLVPVGAASSVRATVTAASSGLSELTPSSSLPIGPRDADPADQPGDTLPAQIPPLCADPSPGEVVYIFFT